MTPRKPSETAAANAARLIARAWQRAPAVRTTLDAVAKAAEARARATSEALVSVTHTPSSAFDVAASPDFAEVRAVPPHVKRSSDELFALLYDQLRSIARARMRHQSPSSTLHATALVHEAFLRVARRDVEWSDQRRFLAVAGQAMRHVLVGHARRNQGRRRLVPLDAVQPVGSRGDLDLLDLDDALTNLKRIDRRAAKVVELKFFAGLNSEEIGKQLGTSARIVDRDWAFARSWIAKRTDVPEPKRWVRVKRVFADALDRLPDEREAFVRNRGGGARTQSEVLRLLLSHGALIEDTATAAQSNDPVTAGSSAPAVTYGGPGRHAQTGWSLANTKRLPSSGSLVMNRYDVGNRIGAGAYGRIHRAVDRLTGQDVVLKIVPIGATSVARSVQREVAMLRRSRAPGIAEILDDGVEGCHAIIVMKLVDGTAFPGRESAGPADNPVTWEFLAPRALALLEAVDRLHSFGILHRDLKPENVLVEASGRVTIVDLGSALERSDPGEAAFGHLAGTPIYLAPEVLGGAVATVASDLYAVGVMLYQSLAAQSPRTEDNLYEIIRLRDVAAPSLMTVAPEVPKHVTAAVDRLVSVDPANRPQSARSAIRLLRKGARI